jgi:hypothetical protein
MSIRRLTVYYAVVVLAVIAGKVIARLPLEYKMENARWIKNFPVLRLNQDPRNAAAPVDVVKTAVIPINGANYNLVTGQAPEADFYVSLPTFTVRNRSKKTINTLSFALYNFEKTGVSVGHVQKKLKIAPGADLVITRTRLVKERINFAKEKTATEPLALVQALKRHGDNGVALLTLPEMWLPGTAGEWTIVITGAKFSDDTFWELTR